MKIKNPLTAKDWTVGRIILWLWGLFATVFVLYSAWGVLQNVMFREGVERGAMMGRNEAIAQVISGTQNCATVTLWMGEEGDENYVVASLVDVNCTPEQVKAAQEAAAPVEVEAPVMEEEVILDTEEAEEVVEE